MTTNKLDKLRDQAGIAIVLFMSLLALCTFAASGPALRAGVSGTGGIVMDEGRFAGMRAVLPARGTVGYLSDIGGDSDVSAAYARAYYLTQYYLVPVVVAADSAHDIVVANFASRSGMVRAAEAGRFRIEDDFSNGVGVLRRCR